MAGGNLSIPPLLKEQTIAEWEHFFRAAVTSLLAQEGGERLAIGILPAYVCRRATERQVVREVVQEAKTLDEAFEILRTLDPPIDRTQAMVLLCRKDWVPGVLIDDYFYELRTTATHAQAPNKIVCTILIAQLPTNVQVPVKEWLTTREEIDSRQERDFIRLVRQTLTDKGVALDKGNRDFARICMLQDESVLSQERREATSTSSKDCVHTQSSHSHPVDSSHDSNSEQVNDKVNSVRYQSRRKRNRIQQQESNGRTYSTWTTRKSACYVCGVHGHFARSCPEQFCQLCGKRGHDKRDCRTKNRVLLAEFANSSLHTNELGVVSRIYLNGTPLIAMLDSGAQPNIVDKETLTSLGAKYVSYPGQVNGVGATPVETLGRVQLHLDIGEKISVDQMFLVLDIDEPTIILGRDFFVIFIYRVRLGKP